MTGQSVDGLLEWKSAEEMITKAASQCKLVFGKMQPVHLIHTTDGKTRIELGPHIGFGFLNGLYVPSDAFIESIGCVRCEYNEGKYELWF